MQTFQYRARKRSGSAVQGTISALDVREAKKLLAQQDLIPLEVRTSAALNLNFKSLQAQFNSRFKGVNQEELLMFNQQLLISYSVGIPLITAFEMIERQSRELNLKNALIAINQDLHRGSYLADALGRHPGVFDEIYVTLIRAGEASGQLEAFLQRISFLLERRAETKAKVKSATFYPKIVLGFMVVATLIFVYVLIPRLKNFLQMHGSDLPPLTKIVIGVSDFAVSYWYLLVAAVFLGMEAFRRITSTPKGRLAWDGFVLKVPVLGELMLQIDLNSFCFVTELLVKSGIPIITSIPIVKSALTNKVVSNELSLAEAAISSGGTMSGGLKQSTMFPELFLNLISVGEESGKIESVLARLSEHYRREIDYKLNNLSKLIEPILLFIIFIGVGILALAIFLPIWKTSHAVH